MTCNFDFDRWHEIELFIINSKYNAGQITKQELDKPVEELDRKLKGIWERLDGSYKLPK
jgi:hypothetical protein